MVRVVKKPARLGDLGYTHCGSSEKYAIGTLSKTISCRIDQPGLRSDCVGSLTGSPMQRSTLHRSLHIVQFTVRAVKLAVIDELLKCSISHDLLTPVLFERRPFGSGPFTMIQSGACAYKFYREVVWQIY